MGEQVTSKVTTIPCMVDRICTGRQIGEYAVNVEAEPTFEGSLVLLDPPADPDLVPFAGEHVVRRWFDGGGICFADCFSLR